MSTAHSRRPLVVLAGTASALLVLAGCSGGGEDSGVTEITYLGQSDQNSSTAAQKLIDAFNEANSDVHVTLVTQPVGAEGDNLVKTKLATDEMEDVFNYNTGSLLQALDPDNTLVDLSGESWVGEVEDDFTSVVSTDSGMYGAPAGAAFAGGILYSVPVYEELGLEVPTTWDEFIANAEKIKQEAPEVAPVVQAYGDTWTSQLLILADFGNINAQDPEWAEDYTAGTAKYAEQPALSGWQHLQEIYDKELLNKDYASLTNEGAIAAIATGEGAHYPMQTNATNALAQNNPDNLDDVGFFALPAEDAADTTATMWQPNAYYIPATTTDAKRDAAKRFIEFAVTSEESCAVSKETGVPTGPYVTSYCALDENVPQMVKDIDPYVTSGATAPALEFLSPIKGPNLENIAVEVGSGIRSAEDGAALYDEDVKKQAQQLGIEGW